MTEKNHLQVELSITTNKTGSFSGASASSPSSSVTPSSTTSTASSSSSSIASAQAQASMRKLFLDKLEDFLVKLLPPPEIIKDEEEEESADAKVQKISREMQGGFKPKGPKIIKPKFKTAEQKQEQELKKTSTKSKMLSFYSLPLFLNY